MNQPLHPLIDWLYGLRGPDLKWELETARRFSSALGHPERRYPCVHVAGTNGKGSVAAMVAAVAREAGLRCGLFTSPHLVSPTERIRIDGTPLPLDRFLARISDLRGKAARALAGGMLDRHPSFFEMMTAAALVEFAEQKVDLAVLEVGLGGRLDATNIVVPGVSVVTTIGLDHRRTLGGSLPAIAREKAGVIKPGVPVVLGPLPGAARAVVELAAREAAAPLYRAPEDVRVSGAGPDGRVTFTSPEARYGPLRLGLEGAHQVRNAQVAVRAVELLRARAGLPIPPAAVSGGLSAVRWPGRLERLAGRPPVVLDAAHNLDGIAALARHLSRRDAAAGARPRRVLVFGLTEGRDPGAMLAPLAGLVDAVVVAPPATSRAIEPERVAAEGRRLGLDTRSAPNAAVALEAARALAGPNGEILGAGSLYLVGDLRRELLGLEGPGHARAERVPPVSGPPARRRARTR